MSTGDPNYDTGICVAHHRLPILRGRSSITYLDIGHMKHTLPDYLPEDPRDVLSRKIRQATQLAKHTATVPHPLVLRDILSDLMADCEALWLEIEDDGREVRS